MNRAESKPLRAVAIWLFACAALVYSVLVLGGVTRLTHSGLSIVEWQPLLGTLPPLTDQAWATLFEKYRATPEYRLVTSGITLARGAAPGGAGCTQCHVIAGSSNSVGAFPRLAGQSASYLATQLRALPAGDVACSGNASPCAYMHWSYAMS
jgi:cytochrome c553